MTAMDIIRSVALRPRTQQYDVLEHYLAQAQRRSKFLRRGLLVLILLPTAVAAAYYGLWASKQYVSEARFIVRGISSPRTSGLDMFFRTFGISRTVDDTNAVQNYMLSRDAVRALVEQLPLRATFSRQEADAFARFPHVWRGDSFESLFEYYLDHVSVVQDPARGLTGLEVVTFRPEDSLQLAQALVGLAEGMVNRMNERARNDAIGEAQKEVAEATQTLIASQLDLTNFRNRELVVDPSKNSASVVDTITSLSKDLAETLAQIQQNLTTSPSNPAIRVWQAKSDALREQIALERAKLGGDNSSLAGKVSAYERLTLVRDLAEKSLTSAEGSLELARQEARRQQIYVEEVVAPNLADKSTEPERFRSVATVFVVCFALYAMIWILFIGAKEHGH